MASNSSSLSQILICIVSPSLISLISFDNIGGIALYRPGKLIPFGLGHVSQVAACGSHSAGILKPSSAGVSIGFRLVYVYPI